MELKLRMHDVIGEEFYVERTGKRLTNIVEGKPQYFLNRFGDIFLGVLADAGIIQGAACALARECYAPINRILVNAPRVGYKDSNLYNVLLSPSGDIVVIDFEQLRLMPRQIELINQLEWYGENLSEREKGQRLDYYIRGLERITRKNVDRVGFMGVYFASGVDRHSYLVGYRQLEREKMEEGGMRGRGAAAVDEQRFHLCLASENLGRLIEHPIVRGDEKETLRTLERLIETIEL